MRKKIGSALALLIICGIGAWLLIRPSAKEPPVTTNISSEKKLRIVTSFYPLQYIASELARERADVVNLTPAGAEPHDYELTSGDMVQMEKSDLVFLLGGGFEPWENNIRDALTNRKARLVGEGLIDRELTEDGKTIRDPHIWLSPKLAKKMAQAIERILADYDKVHAAEYNNNLTDLEKRLDGLDSSFDFLSSKCAKKDFITSHAAFGYLASDYGLDEISISGISPDEDPSPKKIAEVARLAKVKGIKVIFFETLVSPKLSETIASEVGAQSLVLNPLEGLTAAEMKEGATYFTEMKKNLNHLRIALQCT